MASKSERRKLKKHFTAVLGCLRARLPTSSPFHFVAVTDLRRTGVKISKRSRGLISMKANPLWQIRGRRKISPSPRPSCELGQCGDKLSFHLGHRQLRELQMAMLPIPSILSACRARDTSAVEPSAPPPAILGPANYRLLTIGSKLAQVSHFQPAVAHTGAGWLHLTPGK